MQRAAIRPPALAARAAAASCLTLFLATACAQDPPGSAAAADAGSPFQGPVAGLTADEAAALTAAFAANFPLSDDGLRFEDEVCGDIMPTIAPFDLDQDGDHEVLVQWGNSCTSGMAGTTVSLFIMDADGAYIENLGFPGVVANIAASDPGRYPDIEVGGPGFCFGVWAWDGDAYAFRCNLPQEPGGCEFEGRVCPVTPD